MWKQIALTRAQHHRPSSGNHTEQLHRSDGRGTSFFFLFFRGSQTDRADTSAAFIVYKGVNGRARVMSPLCCNKLLQLVYSDVRGGTFKRNAGWSAWEEGALGSRRGNKKKKIQLNMVWYYTIKRTHSGTNNKNSLVALKHLCSLSFFLKCSVQPFYCLAGKSFFAIPQKRTWKLLRLSWSGKYWLFMKWSDTGILPGRWFKHCEVAIFVQFSMETVKKKKVTKKNYPVCQTLAQGGCRSWRMCERGGGGGGGDAGRYLLQAYALMFLMT